MVAFHNHHLINNLYNKEAIINNHQLKELKTDLQNNHQQLDCLQPAIEIKLKDKIQKHLRI